MIMLLEIISPEKSIFKGRVKRVRLPGTKGLFEILYNHAPIISTLERGTIRVIDLNDNKLYYKIKSGIIENKENKIIVLIESA
jgi:F-type H+-transporting ATPase subunit epsilon